ncbi:MAG: spermidine synthase, partial [Armatimonadetes bacterium]|nr:spermidine synthase [Armatimonadota bacterium]
MRSLALIFGSSFLALSTTFAAFLLGLGLGGYLLGPVADRVKNPVRLYVLLEILVGCFALLSPLCFQGIGRLVSWMSLQFPLDFFSLSIIRALLSVTALAIPTMAMGGTLPALASFLVRGGAHPGKSLGLLYGINTLGAALGTVLA